MEGGKKIKTRRAVVQAALVIFIVIFACALFYLGKDHDILLDNKDIVLQGKSYPAVPWVTVAADGDEERAAELLPGDRDVLKVSGPEHTVTINVLDEDTEKVIQTIKYNLKLGVKPTVMLSIPGIVGGAAHAELSVAGQSVTVTESGEDTSEYE
ncbi:MAG: hypothetical protein Q4C86_07165 [bacterium]|nr:hypothetical protein [bacterium]